MELSAASVTKEMSSMGKRHRLYKQSVIEGREVPRKGVRSDAKK